jgi:hypothetical protein
MPRPKRPRLATASAETDPQNTASEEDTDGTTTTTEEQPYDATADQVDEDLLAMVLGYHCLFDIMRLRCVCKKWKEAARKTIVPPTEFLVDSLDKYNAMTAMTTALPNLQQLSICDIEDEQGEERHKYVDGEDPDQHWADETADCITHEIDIVYNFRQLRILELAEYPPLNGRYPVLFNFPLLEKLSITHCQLIKWDLGMLAGLPLLKELHCYECGVLTGNINSLRVLKDTLELIKITYAHEVDGNFMDLADFPHLRVLNLNNTAATGDIREIGENRFPMLEYLYLPGTVYGGMSYKFNRITEVTDFFSSIYDYQRRILPLLRDYTWSLSRASPDAYAQYVSPIGLGSFEAPFEISFVQAGSRLGWRWRSYFDGDYNRMTSCEINWLDPAPRRGISEDYSVYHEELGRIEVGITVFRGHHQPPAEADYQRICRNHEDSFGHLLGLIFNNPV